jgi:hypothetical protein
VSHLLKSHTVAIRQLIYNVLMLGIMVDSYSSSTQEAEAGGSQAHGHARLHRKTPMSNLCTYICINKILVNL